MFGTDEFGASNVFSLTAHRNTFSSEKPRKSEGTTGITFDILRNHLTQKVEDPDEELWQEKALCAQTDPEAFFPEKGGSTREAKKICQGCEVRSECLEFALANDERFGIWGGLSERERRRLKRGVI